MAIFPKVTAEQSARGIMNFGFNTSTSGIGAGKSSNYGYLKNDPSAVAHNLLNYLTPVQLSRLRVDIAGWRDGIVEAERAYYPFRVRQQRIFIDTVLNAFVAGLIERRKGLTLLRSYDMVDSKGQPSETLTQAMEAQLWLPQFHTYAWEALAYGYSLIAMGDIEDNVYKQVSLIPRWFISPDRHEVSSYIYGTSGIDFREGEVADWHIYCSTPSDNGVSPTGYGFLYSVALYEIYLRNTLGYNADFVELFAMPYRVGKTTKTTEAERAKLEEAVRNMGSAGYAITDPEDEITFLESKLGGEGYKGYGDFEKRCQDMIATLILGHADAVSSVPGKLGGTQKQGGATSPAEQALADKQTQDGKYLEKITNTELLPRMRKQGLTDIAGPEGFMFKYRNDDEDEAFRAKEDASNLQTAQIAQTMSAAGLQMDPAYFQERTGIPTTAKPLPGPLGAPEPGDRVSDKAVQARLRHIYNRHKHKR